METEGPRSSASRIHDIFLELVRSMGKCEWQIEGLTINCRRCCDDAAPYILNEVEALKKNKLELRKKTIELLLRLFKPSVVGAFSDDLIFQMQEEEIYRLIKTQDTDEVKDFICGMEGLILEEQKIEKRIDEIRQIVGALGANGVIENNCLRNILIQFYGFADEVADKMEKRCLRRMLPNASQEAQEDEKSFSWLRVQEIKQSLELLRWRTYSDDAGYSSLEESHIFQVIRRWVFFVENVFFFVVLRLHSVMSSCREAVGKFQEFFAALQELKESNQGMVPVVVYKILELLEKEKGKEKSVVGMEAEAEDGRLKEIVFKEMNLSQVIQKFYQLVLDFRFVLKSMGPGGENKVMGDGKYSCEKVLQNAEYVLNMAEMQINEAVSKVDELKKKKSENAGEGSSPGKAIATEDQSMEPGDENEVMGDGKYSWEKVLQNAEYVLDMAETQINEASSKVEELKKRKSENAGEGSSSGKAMAKEDQSSSAAKIRKKFLQLSCRMAECDEHLDTLMQECSICGDEAIIAIISEGEALKKSQGAVRMMSHELLLRLCEPSPEMSQLDEEEILRLISTKGEEEVKEVIAEVEGLILEEVKIYKRINEFRQIVGALVASSDNITLEEISRNAMIDQMYPFPDEDAEMEESTGDEKKSSEDSSVTQNNSLRNAIIQMYGFEDCMADSMCKAITCEPGHVLSDAIWKAQEDVEAYSWERAMEMRENLEELKWKMFHNNSTSSEDEEPKILELIKRWVFYVETIFFIRLSRLCSMMSNCPEAVEKFQELYSALQGLKESNEGMVPMVVYKILGLLEKGRQGPEEVKPNPLAVIEAEDEDGRLRKIVYREMNFNQDIEKFHTIILDLDFVLNATGPRGAKTITGEVQIACEEVLENVEEAIRSTQMKITEAMSKVEDLKAYKNKEKRKSVSVGETSTSYSAKGKAIRIE